MDEECQFLSLHASYLPIQVLKTSLTPGFENLTTALCYDQISQSYQTSDSALKRNKPNQPAKLRNRSCFKLTNKKNFAGIGIWISTNIIIGFRISTNRKPDQDRSRQNLSFWQSMAAKNEHSFKRENRTHNKSDYHARCQRNVEETNWQDCSWPLQGLVK